MSLILVRVKRPDAAHHQDGRIYKTGAEFQMEELVFREYDKSVHGFFEEVNPPEQIKSKELPAGEPATGPAVAAIQEPEPEKPDNRIAEMETPKEKPKLNLKKKQQG